MDTQDHQTDTVNPEEGAHSPTEKVDPADYLTARLSSESDQRSASDVVATAESDAPLDSRVGGGDQPTGEPAAAEPGTGGSLIAEGELSGLRLRWNDIQTGFVDDPRQCVQKADSLVSDVVDQLTAGFAAARSRLEEQWNQGVEVSTEDLRVALKRYRQFFDHLLEV
ncbi:MAG TPA: hypothetical protein VFB19_07350 [Mycobacterium sp.]|nr:hypothetical protein [Mycobacterium sp.]